MTRNQDQGRIGEFTFTQPLDKADAAELSRFIEVYPGIILQVQDTRTEAGTVIGQLVVGQNETLQVKLGRDNFAVAAHPGRFILTAESIAAYREKIRERALAAAQPDVESPVEGFLHGSGRKIGCARDNPGQVFEKTIAQTLTGANLELNIGNMLLFSVGKNDRSSLLAAGLGTNATKGYFRYCDDQGKEYTCDGLYGNVVNHCMRVAITDAGLKGEFDSLRENDANQIGAYAMIFVEEISAVAIFNKDECDFLLIA